MTVYNFGSPTGTKGAFDKAYPFGNPPASPYVYTSINSLHWYTSVLPWDNNSSTYDMHWYEILGDGSVSTSFDLGWNQDWECIIVFQLQFPKPGIYNFNMQHDDGMMIAFDPAFVTKVSG